MMMMMISQLDNLSVAGQSLTCGVGCRVVGSSSSLLLSSLELSDTTIYEP